MKPATQVISPEGFCATRFGFDSQMSTQVEHELSKCSDFEALQADAVKSEAVQHA